MASWEKWTPDPKTGKPRWRAHWRNPAGKPQSKVFPTKRQAVEHGNRMEHDKLIGSYVDPKAGKITFRSYAEDWRGVQVWGDGTAALAEQQLRTHVYPEIGDRPMGWLASRPSQIQALVKKMSESLAPATVGVIYRSRVAAVFAAAVRDRVIPASPCDDSIKLPKESGRADNLLTVDQVLAIAKAVPDHYRALILAGAGTGLRPGELFGLTTPAVEFLPRNMKVERQLVRVRGKGGGVKLTEILKTDASRRTVPIAQVVIDVLAAHLAKYPPHPELGLIFTNDHGEPIREPDFGRVWHTARTAAKVPAWAKGPHQLRHHYASLLINQGASVKVVQKRLGHASARVTLDTYGHLWPDDDDASRQAVDDVLGAALGGRSDAALTAVQAGGR